MGKNVIKVKQIGSPIRRNHTQRETLIGLGLNRIGRVAEVQDTPQARGMIAKVKHLVRVVEAATKKVRQVAAFTAARDDGAGTRK